MVELVARAAAPTMDPPRTTKWIPATELLDPRHTATEHIYVIGHFGIAHVAERSWFLRVEGMVDRPLRIDLAGLRALPSVTVTAVLECFGNPLLPTVPTRRAANVTWRGVPVRALLDAAGADPDASVLWAEGLDFGRFEGTECDRYLKDLPLDVVAERGIVAYELNGTPLTAEHGFPARLFVPGYFGTNNVKWLAALTVANRRPEHLFTTQLYQRVEPGSDRPVPVRALDVTSLITSPAQGRAVAAGETVIQGWAWGVAPVTTVEVRVGDRWWPAELEPRPAGTFSWQRFSLRHSFGPGEHVIAARASDALGRAQPLSGARNEAHSITLTVTG